MGQDGKLNTLLLLSFLVQNSIKHRAILHSKKSEKWSLALCPKKGKFRQKRLLGLSATSPEYRGSLRPSSRLCKVLHY